MIDRKISIDRSNQELQLYHYGKHNCPNGHTYGPAIRDHYLIHFILDGKGRFWVQDREYQLEKQQAFLITPNIVTYYRADEKTPWSYCWIGFNGEEAKEILTKVELTLENPIMYYDPSSKIPQYIDELLTFDITEMGIEFRFKAQLYNVLAELYRTSRMSKKTESQPNYKTLYIEHAISFIEKNYSMPIKVKDIAKYLGINRSYFSTLFKENLQVSPQEYLITFRMTKAADLLRFTALSVSDIAHSVGYQDPFNFSKTFKRVIGLPPSEYRESANLS